MEDEPQVTKDELQILLNLLGPRIKISYPLYSSDLVKARTTSDGYRIDIKVDKTAMEKETDRFGSQASEMPSYSDLLDCFLCAGIISYENLDGFNEMYDRFSSSSKRVFYCPDTNILYHRFLSNYGKIEYNKVGVVEIVRDEIKASINYKYSSNQIRSIPWMNQTYVLINDTDNYVVFGEEENYDPSKVTELRKGIPEISIFEQTFFGTEKYSKVIPVRVIDKSGRINELMMNIVYW